MRDEWNTYFVDAPRTKLTVKMVKDIMQNEALRRLEGGSFSTLSYYMMSSRRGSVCAAQWSFLAIWPRRVYEMSIKYFFIILYIL